MKIFLICLLTLLLILLIISFGIFIYGFIRDIFKKSAPFLPVPLQDLETIQKHLNLNSDSVFYDLGSGDGRVLNYMLKKHPTISAVGYDIDLAAIALSSLRTWRYRARAKVYLKSFYRVNLSRATHIFLYLYPEVLVKLENKFDQELKPGTVVASVDFTFPNKSPLKIIDLEKPRAFKITKKLYIYTW